MSATTSTPSTTAAPSGPAFTLDANGAPVFWPQPGAATPADATPLNPVEAGLWSENPNLVWNADLGVLLTPQAEQLPTSLFWNLFTPAEQVAIATAAPTNPLMFLGLSHAWALGYVDLTSADAQGWLKLLREFGVLNASRYHYVLAGQPPSEDQLASPPPVVTAAPPPPSVPASPADPPSTAPSAPPSATASNTPPSPAPPASS